MVWRNTKKCILVTPASKTNLVSFVINCFRPTWNHTFECIQKKDLLSVMIAKNLLGIQENFENIPEKSHMNVETARKSSHWYVAWMLVWFPDWHECHFPSGSRNLTRCFHTCPVRSTLPILPGSPLWSHSRVSVAWNSVKGSWPMLVCQVSVCAWNQDSVELLHLGKSMMVPASNRHFLLEFSWTELNWVS